MTYPEVMVFKDSNVTTIVCATFFIVIISLAIIQSKMNGDVIHWGLLIFVIGITALNIIFALFPTVTTLSKEGVEVKALGGTLYHKWPDLNDFRIYRSHGLLGIGRRYITFQDPSKKLQKHVFLVPINIWSKPQDVLRTVELYQQAALNDLATE